MSRYLNIYIMSRYAPGRGSCWAGRPPSQTTPRWCSWGVDQSETSSVVNQSQLTWCSCEATSSFRANPRCAAPVVSCYISQDWVADHSLPPCKLPASTEPSFLQLLSESTVCLSASSWFLKIKIHVSTFLIHWHFKQLCWHWHESILLHVHME